MIGFRNVDPAYPFLWEGPGQHESRWNREGEGPVHFFADTPDGAWAAFEKQQHTSALFAPVREAEKPATQRQLDDLDDTSVERLMTDTKKQFAREVRAGLR